MYSFQSLDERVVEQTILVGCVSFSVTTTSEQLVLLRDNLTADVFYCILYINIFDRFGSAFNDIPPTCVHNGR